MARHSESPEYLGKFIKRFEQKFDKRDNGCWEWNATISRYGYGFVKFKNKLVTSHRTSWLIYRGEIPEGSGYHGTCVCHKCDNRKCVNPDHLFLASQAENIGDGYAKDRIKGWRGGRGGTSYKRDPWTNERIERARKIKEPLRELIKLMAARGFTSGEIGKKLNIDRSSAYRISHDQV